MEFWAPLRKLDGTRIPVTVKWLVKEIPDALFSRPLPRGSPKIAEAYLRVATGREAVESRLGHEVLHGDKDLLVQWRSADSLVYDILHPRKVVEAAQAEELEFVRLNLAHTASDAWAPFSPGVAKNTAPPQERSAVDLNRDGQNARGESFRLSSKGLIAGLDKRVFLGGRRRISVG
ncbi:hypothetical protein KFL_000330075 [Klebsormidium nitens]|uniref:Uncharacterized protein n=1 Tax=Klebsormidium nitens TaxID=105231 RepID=A0A1Y1HRE4_KLENI|nr:hypothetical protein KFL_000330075 [Klebsormidium nitens]|eukprot:GAQ79561.1 hypothetical protein KFL_000330075 [Klebsormidium nitens]